MLKAQVEDMEKAMIHMVPLHIHLASNDNTGTTYRLHIPGIREDSPHLMLGDRLILRGLYPEIKAPASLAVEAEIVGLVKAKGWVYVRAPRLDEINSMLPKVFVKGDTKSLSAMYQVQFKVSASPLCTMQDAVSKSLPSEESRN